MKKCLLMDQLCKMEDGKLTATRSRLQQLANATAANHQCGG